MRLFEHPDFEQVVLEAAEHLREGGLLPATIEKDYYATEALRIIAGTVGTRRASRAARTCQTAGPQGDVRV